MRAQWEKWESPNQCSVALCSFREHYRASFPLHNTVTFWNPGRVISTIQHTFIKQQTRNMDIVTSAEHRLLTVDV